MSSQADRPAEAPTEVPVGASPLGEGARPAARPHLAEPTGPAIDPRAWPDFGPYGIDPDRHRDRWAATTFTLFLIPDVWAVGRDGGPVLLAGVLAAAYMAGFLTAWWGATRWAPPGRMALIAALYALGAGYLVAAAPTSSPAVLGYALSVSIMLTPLRWAPWFGAACVLGALGYDLHGSRQPGVLDLLLLALIATIVMNLSRTARLLTALRAAQAEVRVLAVAGERARLARDLHDVLGHSLTAIAVKASLARRLLEREAPVERAMAEIVDVEDLSRRALADIRTTVSAQRRMSLTAELVSARSALRAAEIAAELPATADDVAAHAEEPLAYALREAVTNVVRHSRARHCTVRLGPTWLEVRDDGPEQPDGPKAADGPGAAGRAATPGSGLAGLTERLAAAGGTLTAGPVPGGGFRLRAELPA